LVQQTDRFGPAIEMIKDLRKVTDQLRPYDLIERILTRHEGRRKLLGRLGQEAEDGIDALLTQALAYERGNIPSLTGFLVWMETDDLEIKRQIDSASNQVRIMTVHGSKGLEAPIVILPECEKRRDLTRGRLETLHGQVFWRPGAQDMPPALSEKVEQAKESREAEALRLLYVALTRAEKWLIVGASGDIDAKTGKDWYSRVLTAAAEGLPLSTEIGQGVRLEHGDWSGLRPKDATPELVHKTQLEPYFQVSAPAGTEKQKTIAPSEFTGAKALPGEGIEGDALAYGQFVHLLLEHLPALSEEARVAFFAAQAPISDLPHHMAQMAWSEATGVLRDPTLAHIFAASSLAEVSLTAQIGQVRLHGTVDRLVVSDDKVLAVDIKTNRIIPAAANQIPTGILKQLVAYYDALSRIYPGKTIETAILWSRTPDLMVVPDEVIAKWLDGARYLDGIDR
jgi:ATP-dependent helicase/nuclease subunit A